MFRISTEGKRFVDSEGRQRIFNGVNLCDKGVGEWGEKRRKYNVDFNEETISKLAESGVNLVRLGMTWDAVEPEPGKYDEDYLDRVEKVCDLCEKYGIYFYLDMHQDLFSGRPGTAGDGAPAWACITEGAKFKPVKLVWAEGYFWGKATQKSFDHFWADSPVEGKTIQTYYREMWMHVAERFKNHPALFGYDFLNEPYPGTPGGKVFRKLIGSVAKNVIFDKRCGIIRMAKLLFSENAVRVLEPFNDSDLFRKVTSAADSIIKKFDEGDYSKFINSVAKAVRSVTDNGIIMMENSYYSNLGIPYSTPAVNYDGKREKNLCFAPHAYDLMVDTPAYKYASNSRVGSIFDEHRRSQERLDVPVIVGEWGGQSEGTDWLYHIEYLLDKFDKNQWGQTYWCYYNGLLENPIMRCLRRAAPVAVCGTIKEYRYDREKDIFTLEYEQDREYTEKTEIYIPKAFKNLTCGGEYELSPLGEDGSAILKISAPAGSHKVVIEF